MKTQYLVAVAVIVTTGGAVVWQAASAPGATPASPSSTLQNASAPVLDGVLRPSEFPGVEVASIPDAPVSAASIPAAPVSAAAVSDVPAVPAQKAANAKPWIRVLPGGKIPEGGLGARDVTTWHRENGKTPLGGIALVPDQKYVLHEVARRTKNGVLVHECEPGESSAQHAKHQAEFKAKLKN